MRNQILQGDALEVLRTLPSQHVQMIVTSPPYYGLRDYGTATWEGGNVECDHKPETNPRTERARKGLTGGLEYMVAKEPIYRDICVKCRAKRIDNQIGLEETPEQYVQKLVEVFREAKRVLRNDGTVWLNLGDSYTSHGQKQVKPTKGFIGHRGMRTSNPVRPPIMKELGAKQLLGIPWRVAFALQADGWILRSDIIWNKVNAMPESVQDRPTKSHEYVFLLAKNERYFYDAEAIKEKAVKGSQNAGARNYLAIADGAKRYRLGQTEQTSADGRNKRSVWSIPTIPYNEAHFAVMSPELARICILAGSSDKTCEHCGRAWKRITEQMGITQDGWSKTNKYASELAGTHKERTARRIMETTGFKPACKCSDNTGSAKSIVLDPFSGAGTTALVASQLNRDYLGIELNPEYVTMSKRRLSNDMGMWESVLNPEVA